MITDDDTMVLEKTDWCSRGWRNAKTSCQGDRDVVTVLILCLPISSLLGSCFYSHCSHYVYPFLLYPISLSPHWLHGFYSHFLNLSTPVDTISLSSTHFYPSQITRSPTQAIHTFIQQYICYSHYTSTSFSILLKLITLLIAFQLWGLFHFVSLHLVFMSSK